MIYLHWRISKWLDVDLTMQKSLHNLSSHLNILGGIKEKINKLNIHDECSWKAIEMTRNRSSYSSLNILLYVLFIYIWYEYIMVQNIWRSHIHQLLPTMELNVLEFGARGFKLLFFRSILIVSREYITIRMYRTRYSIAQIIKKRRAEEKNTGKNHRYLAKYSNFLFI